MILIANYVVTNLTVQFLNCFSYVFLNGNIQVKSIRTLVCMSARLSSGSMQVGRVESDLNCLSE